MTTKDTNRWTVTRVLLALISIIIIAGIILAYKEKEMVQYVALAGLFFTFAGAYFKFNFETKPKEDIDDSNTD